MMRTKARTFGIFFSLATMAGVAGAASDLWLHVKVDERDGAKVTVNLPLAIIDKALPMLPMHEFQHAHIGSGHGAVEIDQLRELWQELKGSPDVTFVTVDDDDEHVRVWKEKGWVYVEVRNDDDDESVDVKIPEPVVDALLAGEELDVESAVRALVDHGEGEFVTVRDRNDNVRVWVDDIPEAK